MKQSIIKWGSGVLLLLASAGAFADCRSGDLVGEWTVFYRDNGFPTSVLAPDEAISIQVDQNTGAYSVSLSDPRWRAWSGEWEATCIKGQTILHGAVQRRQGAGALVIEIARVVEAADLLPNADGAVRERQINIRFPQPYAALERGGNLAELAEKGLLASHPGHAHGWE